MLTVGAFAVQDTTPPVISLNLAQPMVTTMALGEETPPGHHKHPHAHKHDHTNANAHVSRSCPVQSNMAVCPDPVCSAHDHHDGALMCSIEVELINNDGRTDTAALTPLVTPATADRDLRSMWLYHYSATDRSGNAAEEVTFELTLYDHVLPTLTVPSEFNYATITAADNPHAESCNMGGVAPCTWIVPASASAADNYDSATTMNGNIKNSCSSDGTKVTTPQAARKINTHDDTDWTLFWEVCDNAGQYGNAGTDNCVDATCVVTISDNTPPILELKPIGRLGGDTYECNILQDGDMYVETGAWCRDLRDSWIDGAYDYEAHSGTPSGAVNTALEETYTITYNCQDSRSPPNIATSITRVSIVVDTEDPAVTITGDTVVENSAGSHQSGQTGTMDTGLFDATAMHEGATCIDKCYGTQAAAEVTITSTLHYGADCLGTLVGDGALSNFPEYTAGAYSVKYVCTDSAKAGARTNSDCRTIQNVDHMQPIIQILGSNKMTLEATHEGNYIDDGATCSDQVDGVISQNVEVSGDVVNLSKVGSYTITYNCKDSAGNAAPTLSREVTVKQTSCPTCTINGAPGRLLIYHEASFPYTDEGAKCTDIIDGAIATIVVDNPVNVGLTGTYTITYRAQNSVGLWNDGRDTDGNGTPTSGCRGTAITYTRTVIVQDTLRPVIKLTYDNQGAVAWGSPAWGTGQAPASTQSTTPANPFNKGVHTAAAHSHPLMAEEASAASINGWVLGAIASAVTGLALLGYSQRKTTVATSVPV